MAKYKILDLDDWQILYVDGEWAHEDHEISLPVLIERLNLDLEVEHADEATSDYIESHGTPDTYDELIEAVHG